MANEAFSPTAVEILVPGQMEVDYDELVGVAAKTPDEIQLASPREVAERADLFFDPSQVVGTVHSVTAVVASVGGAARVVDWVLGRLRDRKRPPVTLKAGNATVTVKPGDDPEAVRRLLEAALQIVSEP